MNKIELKSYLTNSNVSDEYYSLEGGLPFDKLCFDEVSPNREWEVYYSDRGKKVGLKKFNNEDKACRFLIQKIKDNGLLKEV